MLHSQLATNPRQGFSSSGWKDIRFPKWDVRHNATFLWVWMKPC